MKNKLKLRTLLSLTLLLFFLPFLRTCSDQSLDKLIPVPTEITQGSETVETVINDTIKIEVLSKQESKKLLKNALEERKVNIQKAKKEYTYNFYSLLLKIFESGKKEFNTSIFFDLSFYPNLTLVLFFISTITMLILSFFEKITFIKILGILNLFLLITSIILYYACEVIEDVNQIKIGFYLIFINTFLIVLLSGKMRRNRL
ncbi:hypothetical protein A0O34_18290 [Chryseobacterium glaciei]|uniref:Uncharacterized protein n=1 Tax=Chryseobacterium glaciei TaxID=1685010 RepID=A0A172XZG0_9FLAO|nr:hypothetical protein [Chryseobacterium glaciei]ANF52344.1 hypothetical protein A0O34_18290 [Chryseobacterium glaciei]